MSVRNENVSWLTARSTLTSPAWHRVQQVLCNYLNNSEKIGSEVRSLADARGAGHAACQHGRCHADFDALHAF